MISAVVFRKQPRWVTWVAQDRVKIDRAVEFLAASDPGLDLLTHSFFLGRAKGNHAGALSGSAHAAKKCLGNA